MVRVAFLLWLQTAAAYHCDAKQQYTVACSNTHVIEVFLVLGDLTYQAVVGPAMSHISSYCPTEPDQGETHRVVTAGTWGW